MKHVGDEGRILLMKVFALVALLLVVGCSAADHPVEVSAPPYCPVGSVYEVRVSPDLPNVWQHAALDALSTWDAALQRSFKFRLLVSSDVEDPPTTSCVISLFPGGVPPQDWAATYRLPHAFGMRPDTATIYIDVTKHLVDADVAYATLLHELGHVLGLPHDTAREDNTVMWPYITVPGRLGCVDETAACKVWGCVPGCEGNDWLK